MGTRVDAHVIGEHIRRLRSDRRITVRAFAAETGFSASFISQLENGQVAPALGSLHKIAEALGGTLGEVFVAAEVGEEMRRPARAPGVWENRRRGIAEVLMVSPR